MIFNVHSSLEGKHALLGASNYYWINYDEEKLINYYRNQRAAAEGTELHEIAKSLIEKKIKLPRNNKTFNSYVNDAIGYSMTPEQILYYSEYCFGTTDAISFKKDFLRIHDLKTGVTPASINQLLVYTALFCLEYKVKPGDIHTELRIYQNDQILAHEPAADEILPIMDKIITFDKCIRKIRED